MGDVLSRLSARKVAAWAAIHANRIGTEAVTSPTLSRNCYWSPDSTILLHIASAHPGLEQFTGPQLHSQPQTALSSDFRGNLIL